MRKMQLARSRQSLDGRDTGIRIEDHPAQFDIPERKPVHGCEVEQSILAEGAVD